MLRINQSFLDFAEALYDEQGSKEDIILKKYAKGDLLLVQDTLPNKVLIIKSGITKCYFSENNEKEYIFEFLGKGEIVGEIEIFRKKKCMCSIEAMTEVWAFAFSIDIFKNLLEKNSQLKDLLLDSFAERIYLTGRRASYQQLYAADYSLSRLLELLKQEQIQLTKEEMASYLGISVRSLNRSLKSIKSLEE